VYASSTTTTAPAMRDLPCNIHVLCASCAVCGVVCRVVCGHLM
jgi:hypothetical protein